jgi:hypothetical protein
VTDAFGREMSSPARDHTAVTFWSAALPGKERVYAFGQRLIDQSLKPMMRLDRDDFGSNRPEYLNGIGANSAEDAGG